ncbi:MAG: uroporphyrinogen-III synthase [Arcobacteraceae bacterium]
MNDIYLLNDMHVSGIKNIPLLGIRFLPRQIDILKYDALVFTSKNAVYALDSFNPKWKSVPCFVIAQKTANVLEQLGGNVAFIGNSGHGNDFASELIPVLKNKRVLYLRAKKVVSNLVSLLKEAHINVDEAIIYETACNKIKHLEVPKPGSVIIFSSPSTIECFFENFSWESSYKAVAIGQTTAQYLPTYVPYVVSKTTSIEDCIALAKEEAMGLNNGK